MSDHLPSVTIVRRIKAAPAKPFDGGRVDPDPRTLAPRLPARALVIQSHSSALQASRGVASARPSNEGVLMLVVQRLAAAWIDGKPARTDCCTVKLCC
jgi:hypothetical protein